MNKRAVLATSFLILMAAGAISVLSRADTPVDITAETWARADPLPARHATETCANSDVESVRVPLGPTSHARRGRVFSGRVGIDPGTARIRYAIEDVRNVGSARRKVYPEATCRELCLRENGTFEIDVASKGSVVVFMASGHWSFEHSGTSRRISASQWTDLILMPPTTINGVLSTASWERHHPGTPAPRWVMRLRLSRVEEVKEIEVTPDLLGHFRVAFGGAWNDIKLIVEDRTNQLGSVFVKDVRARCSDQVDVGAVNPSYDVWEYPGGKILIGNK